MKISKKRIKITSYLLFMLINSYSNADNRIIIHLEYPPNAAIIKAMNDYEQETPEDFLPKKPSALCKQMIKSNLRKYITPKLSGFIALYAGYMDISNPDGLISFPLRHVSPKIYIAITPEIKLVNVTGSTYSTQEFIINEKTQPELYLLEKKDDKENQPYWEVKKILIPEDKKINPITIVLLSNPKNIALIEGDFITEKNVQLVLPPIFVIDNKNQEKILLKNLSIKGLFEQITFENKKTSEKNLQKLITNI